MEVVIILGIIFVLWEAYISHLIPVQSREYYEGKEEVGYPKAIATAIVGILDVVCWIGIVGVMIASFFVMHWLYAIIFCVIIGLLLLFNPSALKSSRNMSKALRGKK